MKNRIQYVYSCSNAMFNYIKDNDLEKLISELKKCEQHALENIDSNKSNNLWFKFGDDDTLSTTISDIERDLKSGTNRAFIIDCFKLVTKDINPKNELKVFFS